MKLEIEMNEELLAKLSKFADAHGISREQATLYLLSGNLYQHESPAPKEQDMGQGSLIEGIQSSQAKENQKMLLMQGASMLTQCAFMAHESSDSIWESFIGFHSRLKAKAIGDNLEEKLFGYDDDREK